MYSNQFEENGKQAVFRFEQELISQEVETVRVEDDRTGTSLEILKQAFTDTLLSSQDKYESIAALHDYYIALADAG